jgi:hypothetical protein
MTARVFGKPIQNEVQQFYVRVAPMLLDGCGVVPRPAIEVVERDDALAEAGKVPAEI